MGSHTFSPSTMIERASPSKVILLPRSHQRPSNSMIPNICKPSHCNPITHIEPWFLGVCNMGDAWCFPGTWLWSWSGGFNGDHHPGSTEKWRDTNICQLPRQFCMNLDYTYAYIYIYTPIVYGFRRRLSSGDIPISKHRQVVNIPFKYHYHIRLIAIYSPFISKYNDITPIKSFISSTIKLYLSSHEYPRSYVCPPVSQWIYFHECCYWYIEYKYKYKYK